MHELAEGFLVKGFDPQSENAWFLQPERKFVFDADWQIKEETSFEKRPLQKLKSVAQNFTASNLKTHAAQSISALEYEKQVELALESIAVGNFSKVVLARKKEHTLSHVPTPESLFINACQLYPDAFVYLLKWENDTIWIGASPELLVHADQYSFRTQALAGTRRQWDTSQPIQQTLWSQKEIEEQAMVSRYIIDCFKKIRVREYIDKGPYTVLAGDLLHLKTDFIVDKTEANYPNIESAMLHLLHPTSAVCGMPKPEALNFIQQVEGFERELYSGFIGPIHIEGESHLYVNLRCGKLQGNQLSTFAGAGITQSSVPAAEWAETQAKMQTMLRVFRH